MANITQQNRIAYQIDSTVDIDPTLIRSIQIGGRTLQSITTPQGAVKEIRVISSLKVLVETH